MGFGCATRDGLDTAHLCIRPTDRPTEQPGWPSDRPANNELAYRPFERPTG